MQKQNLGEHGPRPPQKQEIGQYLFQIGAFASGGWRMYTGNQLKNEGENFPGISKFAWIVQHSVYPQIIAFTQKLHDISKFPLSSAEASLCCGKAGEKEKESAWGTKWKERREAFPSSHRPPRAFYFFAYFILMGYPVGASAEERAKFLLQIFVKLCTP